MQNVPRLILASQSPRRRELLQLLGIAFETVSVDADESVLPHEIPSDYTLRVSALKVRLAAEQYLIPDGAVVLAADTTVADGQTILGKPSSPEEADLMLSTLRAKTHQVYTAIALLDKSRGRFFQDLAVTDVTMRDYSADETQTYIKSGDPFDKAGSYAIQNRDFHPVQRIHGCYANVVGLPLCHVLRQLKQWGIHSPMDLPSVCQDAHEISCPVYSDILSNVTFTTLGK